MNHPSYLVALTTAAVLAFAFTGCGTVGGGHTSSLTPGQKEVVRRLAVVVRETATSTAAQALSTGRVDGKEVARAALDSAGSQLRTLQDTNQAAKPAAVTEAVTTASTAGAVTRPVAPVVSREVARAVSNGVPADVANEVAAMALNEAARKL